MLQMGQDTSNSTPNVHDSMSKYVLTRRETIAKCLLYIIFYAKLYVPLGSSAQFTTYV